MGEIMNYQLDKNFWRNKKVFLTGHNGFKGGWLVVLLKQLGAKVAGYSLAYPGDSAFSVIGGSDLLESETIGDVRDYETLFLAVSKNQPDVIIHFAAQPLVLEGYHTPRSTYETNVMGTVNILEIARTLELDIPLLVITTDKVYENTDSGNLFKTSDRLSGEDPYSSSKACADLICTAYRKSFFTSTCTTKLAVARAGNVIGGGDWSPDRILTDAYKSITKSIPLLVRQPNAVRPWQHVIEPLYGYCSLIEQIYTDQDKCTAWNFGPSQSENVTVRELLSLFSHIWGAPLNVIYDDQPKLKEALTLRLSVDETISKLRVDSKLNFKKSIEWTVNWYKEFSETGDKNRLLQLTKDQIDAYLKLGVSQ
jgi:CDP-glucose 4,6-dehydratase